MRPPAQPVFRRRSGGRGDLSLTDPAGGELEMPFITIRVTGGREAPSPEQKARLIAGATQLVVDVLGKNPETTHVIIEEVPMDNWGIGGISTTERRAAAARARRQAPD